MDAKMAIQLIMNNKNPRHEFDNLIHDFKYLMRQLGVVWIHRIYREGNPCADLLAAHSSNLSTGYCVYHVVPN